MATWAIIGWVILALTSHLVVSQCPGPDWPNCAAKSRGLAGHFGWEIWHFTQNQYIEGREDATDEIVHFYAVNTADGSVITCSLWDPNGANASLVFDSRYFDPLRTGSGCITEWGHAAGPVASQAVVIYHPRIKEMTIMQNWTCRETNGQMQVHQPSSWNSHHHCNTQLTRFIEQPSPATSPRGSP